MMTPVINSRQNFKLHDIVGLTLILISSILLGIWAVKGTIALRNILLGVGTPLSIFYCYQYFKFNQQKIPFKNFIPIILIGLMFCWIIFHYLFLSRFPEIQLQELKSTWFRTLLASIIGFGTGLAVLKRPNAINFLWLGILASFLYLLFKYIPFVISARKIFYYDFHYRISEQFIFTGKIGGVLVGTILIAGLLGTLLDRLSAQSAKFIIVMFAFWLIGTSIALYVYVYILDSRNGIGIVLIIYGAVTLKFVMQMGLSVLVNRDFSGANKIIIFILLIMVVAVWFTYQQTKINPGWATMLTDFNVAIQLDKFLNWRDPSRFGYPWSDEGAAVARNTYERIAWATAGIKIFIPENPFGVGITSNSFGILMGEKYAASGNYVLSTHSAWIDMALAFGIPSLVMTLGALISIFTIAIMSNGPFRYLSAILSFAIVILYAVGELSSKHAIEILYFLIALTSSLLFQMPLLDQERSKDVNRINSG